MADITYANTSTTLIKNGTIIVQTGGFGYGDGSGIVPRNTDVLNTPTMAEISGKYSNRFNDPSYYYGVSTVNGGGA